MLNLWPPTLTANRIDYGLFLCNFWNGSAAQISNESNKCLPNQILSSKPIFFFSSITSFKAWLSACSAHFFQAGWHYEVPTALALSTLRTLQSGSTETATSTLRYRTGTICSHLESGDTKGLHSVITEETQLDACHGSVRLQSFS